MSITSYSTTRLGTVTVVTVTSDLSGTVYYHWYQNGSWVGVTLEPQYSFVLEEGDEVSVVCQDSNDEAYDPIANAPADYPARQTLFWVASADSDVGRYRVEEQEGAGAWTEIGRVSHDNSWAYMFLTGRLTDLTAYQFRVIPVDAAGNDGTAVTAWSGTVVRRPDAPDFSVSFDPGTDKMTFTSEG